QQPIDAMAMVLMYHQAFHLTNNKEYLNKLYTSFLWFLGENDLRMSLYDFETKGCCPTPSAALRWCVPQNTECTSSVGLM
ncbi:MAG: hypothetical protein R6U20_04505, partial [Longimonas sp.]|uniref:hypothetical protein n=1 Tax=Longimonas sp. TaxID=2039626 RepID=UPI003976506B